MISAKASQDGNFKYSGLPISSTYLVILQRYLSFLMEDQSCQVAQHFSQQADDFLESTVSLGRIEPLLEALEAHVGHQAFGIEIGRHMHPSDYGIFGYAMMNCERVGKALQTAARLKAIRNQNLTASFFQDGQDYIYQLSTSGQQKSLEMLVELDISAAYQFGKMLVGPHKKDRVKLSSVSFTHGPLGPVSLYEKRFNCPVKFNQSDNSVRLAKDVVALPIYAANPKILSVLEKKILRLIEGENRQGESLKDQVLMYLTQNSGHAFPCIVETAAKFNMSLSAFKKTLKEQQTCFQDICNEVKRDKSFKLLKCEDIAIKKIAFDLGFSNPSAFNRAFKRWTGESPLSYRKALLNHRESAETL